MPELRMAPLARNALSASVPDSIVIAFDFGTRRIGVAIANSVTRAARPLSVIEREGDARWSAIAALLNEWKPQLLLVGRPTQADGTEDLMTARAERFARRLRGRFGLPVMLVDERFSSAVVEGRADDAAAAVARRGMGSDSASSVRAHHNPIPAPAPRPGSSPGHALEGEGDAQSRRGRER